MTDKEMEHLEWCIDRIGTLAEGMKTLADVCNLLAVRIRRLETTGGGACLVPTDDPGPSAAAQT